MRLVQSPGRSENSPRQTTEKLSPPSRERATIGRNAAILQPDQAQHVDHPVVAAVLDDLVEVDPEAEAPGRRPGDAAIAADVDTAVEQSGDSGDPDLRLLAHQQAVEIAAEGVGEPFPTARPAAEDPRLTGAHQGGLAVRPEGDEGRGAGLVDRDPARARPASRRGPSPRPSAGSRPGWPAGSPPRSRASHTPAPRDGGSRAIAAGDRGSSPPPPGLPRRSAAGRGSATGPERWTPRGIGRGHGADRSGARCRPPGSAGARPRRRPTF